MKTNSIIQKGKLAIQSVISDFQRENQVPNFIVEMILQDILVSVKEYRMCELYAETIQEEKEDGNQE